MIFLYHWLPLVYDVRGISRAFWDACFTSARVVSFSCQLSAIYCLSNEPVLIVFVSPVPCVCVCVWMADLLLDFLRERTCNCHTFALILIAALRNDGMYI